SYFFALAAEPHGTPTRLPRWGPRHPRRELSQTPRRSRGAVRHPSAAAALGAPVWPQALLPSVPRVTVIGGLDWSSIEASLDAQGFAKLPAILSPSDCESLAALYA